MLLTTHWPLGVTSLIRGFILRFPSLFITYLTELAGMFVFLLLAVPVGTFINCARRPCFRASARGIGYSFQLAITTPRIDLTGYGTATAQS